jgi:hypothetical protein
MAETSTSTSDRISEMFLAASRMAVRVSHAVGRAGAVAAFENLLHARGHAVHLLGRARLHIHGIDALDGREVAQHGDRHQDGIALDFGLSHGVAALVKGPDHGELEAIETDLLIQRGGAGAVHGLGERIAEQDDFLAQRQVARVEAAPGADGDVAHGDVGIVGADDRHVAHLARDQHGFHIGHDGGGGDHVAGQRLADGFDVGQLDVIGVGGGDRRPAAHVAGEDDVGADAFDLLQDVIAAGERDRHYQDHRSGADHHAEPGEQGTDRVGAQRLQAETKGFAETHGRVSCPPDEAGAGLRIAADRRR